MLLRDGPNSITPPRQVPAIVKFLKQMFGGFAALLWFGAILCFIAYTIQSITEDNALDDYVSVLALVVALKGLCIFSDP